MTEAKPITKQVGELPTCHSYSWCDRDRNRIKVGYIWTIERFSQLKQKCLDSSIFSASEAHESKWSLQLFPKGCTSKHRTRVSLFLHYIPDNRPLDVIVAFEFAILNNKGQKTNVKKVKNHTFTNEDRVWGFSRYVWRNYLLRNKDNGLLENDVLMVQCEVLITTEPVNTHETLYPIGPEDSRRHLTEDLERLFNHKNFTDVVLVAENKELPAHRAILAARSPVLATVFRVMEEKRLKKVEITDISYSVLEALVRFIYTGKPPTMDEEMAKHLLTAADKYHLMDLKSMCEESLSSSLLTSEKVADLIPIANLHNAKHLRAQITNFLKSHDTGTNNVINFLLKRHNQPVS